MRLGCMQGSLLGRVSLLLGVWGLAYAVGGGGGGRQVEGTHPGTCTCNVGDAVGAIGLGGWGLSGEGGGGDDHVASGACEELCGLTV